MRSDNPRASVAAAQALLDRGCGKPQQSVDANVEGGSGLYALLASLGRGGLEETAGTPRMTASGQEPPLLPAPQLSTNRSFHVAR
jgi:hypothetical protein